MIFPDAEPVKEPGFEGDELPSPSEVLPSGGGPVPAQRDVCKAGQQTGGRSVNRGHWSHVRGRIKNSFLLKIIICSEN